jgi:hypothetical protein
MDPPGVDAASAGLYNGSLRMIPMEMDEEMDSLMHETGDFSGVVSKLTHRKKYQQTATVTSTVKTGFRGLLRTKTAYVVRNIVFVACLGWLVLLFLGKMGEIVGNIEQHNMEEQDPRGPHQSSFGGEKNVAHPAGAKAHHKHEIDEDELALWIAAEDNVGVSVKSVSDENIINHNGHYWHDPYNSPFSSLLYNRTHAELAAEQKEFDAKMNETKNTWGAWTFIDNYYDDHKQHARPKPDYRNVNNRDLPLVEFPKDCWQLDEEYVGKFVDQARAMIHRVKEGIYAHYEHPTVMKNGTKLTGEALKDRNALFQVIIEDYVVVDGKAAKNNSSEPLPGIAYLTQNAWDGLVRKLLHSLITNDMFFVVMGGDGVAAGHMGNNFLQTSVMQFHYLMEPVFDFLGMRLISRNMAMDVYHTSYSALGGADIYGEADVMWYHSPWRQETKGQLDLFHKQAILSGERVPVLLTPDPVNLGVESNGAAWIGNLQPGAEMCEVSTEDSWQSLPTSCQLVHCPDNHNFWPCAEFNSVCWEPRMNLEPPVQQDEYIRVPRGKKVPGPRKNKLEGHKLSLLLLHALDAAFDQWVKGIEAEDFPLVEDYWHVGELYGQIRESVRSHIPRFNENVTECDGMFKDFPIVCHVEMHAYTEWTPRVNPDETGLGSALYPTMENLDFEAEELYHDVDVLPLKWKLPLDEVDVHAIAISTAIPPLVDKDDGYNFDDDFNGDDTTWIDREDDYVLDDNGTTIIIPTASPIQTPAPATAKPSSSSGLVAGGNQTYPPTALPTEQSSGLVAGGNQTNPPTALPTERGGGRRIASSDDELVLPIQREMADTSNEKVAPGKGWMVYNRVPGFCDGSSQSTCNRSPTNTCLLAGHNDFHGGILGDALSGWLMFRLNNVKEGVVLARLDTTVQPNSNAKTEGWNEVNQGNGGNRERHLSIPADFEFDYAINGKVTTLLRSEFIAFGSDIVDGMTLFPLLLDESMSEQVDEHGEGRAVDVAIRIRSTQGRAATILVSHLYYA